MKARLSALRPVLGLALTVVFLVLALQKVDLGRFIDELRGMNYLWLVPSAICTLVGYVLRTARWRIILRGAARAPLSTLFPILIMGFAVNNLLPGRLGEFWRAYLLGRKRGVPKTSALASVVVERLFDGLTLVALLAIVSRSIELPERGREVELLAAAVFAGATLLVLILLWKPGIMRAPLRSVLRPIHAGLAAGVEERFVGFVDGLASLRRTPVLAFAALLSIGVWTAEAGSYVFLSRGINLRLTSNLELTAIVLAVVIINLGIMIPSGPGYLGAQEFFGTTALSWASADPQAALAFVFVSHAVQYTLVTGLGLVFFAREHISPRSLRPALAEQASP